MGKLKIAMVSPTILPSGNISGLIGGAETYAVSLAVELAILGHSITLFTATKNGGAEFQYSENLKIKSLKTNSFASFGDKDPFSNQIIHILLKEQFDIIHLHQVFNGFTVASSLAGKIKRIPTFATDHGGGALLYRAFPQVCANMPNAFIAVSQYSAKYLQGLAPHKTAHIAYGGVNTALFHPNYDVAALRTDLHLDGFKVVLCVGRLLSCKGFDVSIKAMYHLPKNTKLVIVGPIFDLAYYSYLKQIGQGLGDRLQFVGHASDQDLPKFYNLCDVFIRSSVNRDCFGHYYNFPELLGLVKFEAMACGKPVVVSDVGGLPEQVLNGRHGYVVKANSDVELAAAVNCLLSDEQLCRKMGRQSLDFVKDNFSWHKIAQKVASFYESAY